MEDDQIEIQFITFNYTDIVGRIIGNISDYNNTGRFYYYDPLFIHGKIDDA